ncbi:hypothetical protein VKT23_020502 [Stygiomarasmius scandens]|uniref:DNA 3'-5' helicase n=1 Tax=Marasmiellus scandens TaxID=2682957 RepID=A0ABR1IJ54_9AGAR
MQNRPHTPLNQPKPTPTTPRKHKRPSTLSQRLQGIKIRLPSHIKDPDHVRLALKTKLSLSFQPDDWQAHLVYRILQGYDSICVAAMGLGKSLIFEGTAKLAGKGRVVLVICPLKALERDQLRHAQAKGLHATIVNEDTPKTKQLWKEVCYDAQVVYLSPKMTLSDEFIDNVWTNVRFRQRLGAVFVDEGHCIDEWGDDKFRPQYRQLGQLRSYTGMEVPYVACTATCRTKTFDLLWVTLRFGCRPFWGIDIGADRPNLFFHTRILKNTDNPVLDALNLLPSHIDDSTRREDIGKSLFYFDSEGACRTAVETIRKCLPENLRDCVYAFSSDMSEKSKEICWGGLSSGHIRIVCATDAAGMGCSIPDVKNSVIFGLPHSLSVIAQRWGRAGRNRTTEAVCLLFVPPWAFQPEGRSTLPAGQHITGQKPIKESGQDVTKRENLDLSLRTFINVHVDQDDPCSHTFIREVFRPQSQLDTYHSLTDNVIVQRGRCSQLSPFELSWTVLNVACSPSSMRCCGHCNPELVQAYGPADEHDERLFTYAHKFFFPLGQPPSPPSPPLSPSKAFSPFPADFEVSDDDKENLRQKLIEWRNSEYDASQDPLLDSELILPPKQLNNLVKFSSRLLRFPRMSANLILATIKWETAPANALQSLVPILDAWQRTVPRPAPISPSQQRARKRQKRNDKIAATPIKLFIRVPTLAQVRARVMQTTAPSSSLSDVNGDLSSCPPKTPVVCTTGSRVTAPTQASLARTRPPLQELLHTNVPPSTPTPATTRSFATPLHTFVSTSVPSPTPQASSPYYCDLTLTPRDTSNVDNSQRYYREHVHNNQSRAYTKKFR